MSEIIVAKTAGFCFGVKRAVDMAYEKCKEGPGYTYGPLIHNEEFLKDLEKKGVKVAWGMDDLKDVKEGYVIGRSHGLSRREYEDLKATGLEVLDATCPFVKRIHKIVSEASAAGDYIIITGDPDHAEVKGIVGWGKDTHVVRNAEELAALNIPLNRHITLVSQTTFNHNLFKVLIEMFSEKGYNINIVNTICSATQERQEEAQAIAASVDAMVVIGGKSSSNTRKLYEICSAVCNHTYLIQTAKDLEGLQLSFGRIGVTAGASTPQNIISEVINTMAELSFEQMLDAYEKTIHTGEIVKGEVIDVKEDRIVLNIGYKSDGTISRAEYSDDSSLDLTKEVAVGQELEAKVLKVNDGEGQVALSYKRLAADRSTKILEEAFNNKEVITAKVTQVLNGGLGVNVEGIRVFIPASLVSDTYERNLAKYDGQNVSFIITEFNPRKRRIIGDCKQLIVAEKAKLQKELFERIEPGMTVEGTVKNVTDFGAFIDLGGADGLLHISEMSWGRIENPKKVFKSGDKVTVFIKDINGSKIALSMKFPDKNPWANAAEKYASGNIVEGTVARMTDFGAFVELEPGIDALLHVSQISRQHVDKPSDVLSIGQKITAKVVDFNEEGKKISLSMKSIEEPAEETTEE